MAEITFDKFWGGMSPTSLYAKPGETAYCEGLEVGQDISKVKNLPSWRKNFLTDGNDMTVHFTATGSLTSSDWYAGEGGQIYGAGDSDNTPSKQLGNTNPILDQTSILGGIFLIQEGSGQTVEVSRMDLEEASNGDAVVLEDIWTSADEGVNWNGDNTYINSFGEASLVVAKGTYIYFLSVSGITLGEEYTFNLGRTVVGITTSTDFVKFYTKDGRILMYNKNYTLVSETYTGQLFHKMLTVNNRDYVVAEDGLYYAEGNTLVDVLLDGNKGLYIIDNNRNIFTWRSYIFLDASIDGESKTIRIGVDNAGFPEAMTILPITDSLGNSVTKTYGTGGRFILSAGLNVTTTGKGIYTLDGSTEFSKGVLITEKFNAGSQGTLKETQEVIISGRYNNGSTIQSVRNNNEDAQLVPLENGGDKNELVRSGDLNNLFLDSSLKVILNGNDQLYSIIQKYNDEQN